MALLQRFSFIMLLVSLVGCGGGGDGFSSSGTSVPDDSTDTIVISLTISDENITEQSPATITATVMQGSTPVVGSLVTFVIDNPSRGVFESETPETDTGGTDIEGIATIVLNAGESAGFSKVTATVDSAEPVSIIFNSQGSSAVVFRLGSGSPFVEGAISLSREQIPAGGTSEISVSLIADSGESFRESIEIKFTSDCALETVPSAEISAPFSFDGQVNATYLAKGCSGNDEIKVNVTINGKNLSASGIINIIPADVRSIEFVSSTPQHIALQGAGSAALPEKSTIVFRVLDTDGNPVKGRDVSFSLVSDGGDILLTPVVATSNFDGLVQTTVNAGTVSRVVSVKATVEDTSAPVVETISHKLYISSGILDQDSISISADILNPEGWSIDGTEVIITARLADSNNNPPPPTAVYFTTEGGSIENLGSLCITGDDGSCTVTWRSQNPKPEGHVLGDLNNLNHVPEESNTMGQKMGGRATVLATTIGGESFPDLNGNGRFDVCEVPAFTGGVGKPCGENGNFDESGIDITYSGNDVGGNSYDLPEAFVDHNEDGVFNPTQPGGQMGGELEEPVDYNSSLTYDSKDGKYNGLNCAIPAHEGCSTETAIDVRGSVVLVMSGSTANFVTTLPVGGQDINIVSEGTGNATVIISDLHNQPMPANSVVTFSVAGFGSVASESTFTWNNWNRNGGSEYSVTIKGEKEDLPKYGTLWVTVETPSGASSAYPVANIVISDPIP
ncbi:MAG: hypothetical protein HRT52_08465 [Colwellia sp.]|nr:hypothetical protein [Colwellia sp.]